METSEPSASSSTAASAAAPATHAVSPAGVHPGVTTPRAHTAPPPAKHVTTAPGAQAAVEHELQQGKTVLILFWNRHGSDDLAIHNALPAVQHALGGRIAVHYASAGQVGTFGTITHAVQVTQTPTLLIVNPHGHTTVLTGLKDAFAIQQAVSESHHS